MIANIGGLVGSNSGAIENLDFRGCKYHRRVVILVGLVGSDNGGTYSGNDYCHK